MEDKPIEIFLVDDHKIVRDGIKSLLIPCRNIIVTGEAGTGKELLGLLGIKQPGVVVLDLVLPDISGMELTKTMAAKFPMVKVLILTAEMDENIIVDTIKNGACGFLNKDVPAKEFIDAITLVAQGECYFGQRISGIIYKSYINKIQNRGAETNPADSLSPREKEIIVLLSEGITFKEIGDILYISPRTVENHKNNILEKLGLKNTIELVKFAIKHGIITI